MNLAPTASWPPATASRFALAWDAWRAARGGRDGLEARQRARLASLVAFARTRSPYYAEHYRGLDPDTADLRDLPPVVKAELMKRFDEWVVDPQVTRSGVEAFVADHSRVGELFLGRYLVWRTSGSTGVLALLVQDRAALNVYDTLQMMRVPPAWLSWRDAWAIARSGSGVAALMSPGHSSELVRAEYRRRALPWRRRRTHFLSMRAPVAQLVRELNALQPAVVSGHTHEMMLLAEEQEGGRLRVRPRLVFTAGEALPGPLRARIRTAFGCSVGETYACGEAFALSYGCTEEWLHLNADWAILEPVDEHFRPVPPGAFSHTALLTNLANRVQPLLRYDLGDRVMLRPDPCPCGNPLPAMRVEGRTDEMLALTSAGGTAIRLAPLPLIAVVRETPGVQRFQLIQTGPAQLTIRLQADSPEEAVWKALRERILRYLAEHGLSAVKVERSPDPPARDPGSNKFRQVWSELPR